MMYPTVLLATIRHTGTHHVIASMNRAVRLLDANWRNADSCTVLVGHLDDISMPLIREAAQKMPVYTTQRAHSETRESWRRRDLPLEQLQREIENYGELIRCCNPNVIHLGRQWA